MTRIEKKPLRNKLYQWFFLGGGGLGAGGHLLGFYYVTMNQIYFNTFGGGLHRMYF